MLLEIENKLYERVHKAVGHSAHVIRLAEELDLSGQVVEQTSIVVSFVSAQTENLHEGAYIPTVRARILSYTITVISKQSQREGHAFALPLLDIIADSVTGWVPEINGFCFFTGFELKTERFAQITEASQYIYEQKYTITIDIPDGRFFSYPQAAFDSIDVADFLPQRKCLMTKDGTRTGLAIWRRKTGADTYEEWIIKDLYGCEIRKCDHIELHKENGDRGIFIFTPCEAYAMTTNGDYVLQHPEKITEGQLKGVWEFVNPSPRPPWMKVLVGYNLWVGQDIQSAITNQEIQISVDPQLVIDTYGQ